MVEVVVGTKDVLDQLDEIIELLERAAIPADSASRSGKKQQQRYARLMARYFRDLEKAFPYDEIERIYNKYVKIGEARRTYAKVADYFHNFEHDPTGTTHCEGSEANPYTIKHFEGGHVISLSYARGHGKGNEVQWFHFVRKLDDGYDLESGEQVDIPAKRLWNTKESSRFQEAGPIGEADDIMTPLLRMFRARLLVDMVGEHVSAYLQGSAEMTSWGRTLGGIPITYEGPPMIQAVAYAQKHCASLVTKMDEETKQRLARVISNGIKDKRGIPGLAKDIKGEFADMTKFRSQMIARTETNDALSQAFMDRASDMGINGKEWVVHSPKDCVCVDNDGVIVPLDGTFPSGHDRPPAHPNCECALAPARLPEKAGAEGTEGRLDPAYLKQDTRRAGITRFTYDPPAGHAAVVGSQTPGELVTRLTSITVDDALQKKGIGSALVDKLARAEKGRLLYADDRELTDAGRALFDSLLRRGLVTKTGHRYVVPN